jgi:hypothetical protein
MTAESLKITALTPAQAAKILASAYRQRVDAEQVRQVAEEAQIIRADGTFSLIEYTAYLAGEATRGGID